MNVAPVAGLFFVFAAVVIGAWGLIAAFAPTLRQRSEAAEKEYHSKLVDMFLDSKWAKIAAWFRYFGAAVIAVGVPLLTGSVVFGLALAVGAYILPPYALEYFARKRYEAIEEQLPIVLGMMADGTRAGLSLTEAISLVAAKAQPPLSKEFEIIGRSLDLGNSLERTLQAAKERLQAPNAQLMIAALLINQEQGGDVARVLERVSKAARELDQVHRRVQSETASVRFSAKAMVATIPLFAGLLYLMDPASVSILFITPIGNLMLLAIILLAYSGYKMIMKLADPENI
jgi:tight adherence protein B